MVCIVTVYVTTSVCLSASHDKQLLDAENKELKRTSPVSTHILHRGWLQCLWKVITTFSITQNSGICLHSTCVWYCSQI